MIVASSVLPITEIFAIEDHKLDNTFLHVAFRSQSLLNPISDQTGSDTIEGPEKATKGGGVNESQSKFLEETRPIPQIRPDTLLF
jgi:hypothetical protein